MIEKNDPAIMTFANSTALKTTAILICLALPTVAQAQSYFCKINAKQTNGWVPESVQFELDVAQKSVTVADPYTLHSAKTAPTVSLRVNTDKRAIFIWKTGRLRSSSGDEVIMQYKGTFLKKKNLLLIYAKPLGFHDDFTARGKCSRTKR